MNVKTEYFTKEINLKAGINHIEFELTIEEQDNFKGSTILEIEIQYEEQVLKSDKHLIFNPQLLPEAYNSLQGISSEQERMWLFKILNKYANLPSFNYLMPLIERLADYGIFEMDQHEREELLLNIQNKLTNCKPYNPKTKLKEIIERFKKRHERRLEKTFEQDPSLSFLTIVNSFVMINKLILWSVNRGIHDIHYLRHIKKNMIDLSVKKKKIIGNIPFERLKNSRLLEHFIMLIYFIEQSHKNSWEFRKANYIDIT